MLEANHSLAVDRIVDISSDLSAKGGDGFEGAALSLANLLALRIFVAFALVVHLVAGLAGCGSVRRPGFPRESANSEEMVEQLDSQFPLPASVKRYFEDYSSKAEDGFSSSELEQLAASRNSIIGVRIAIINLNYNDFVASAAFNRQLLDTGSELIDLGVDIATTAVGAEGAKTVLGAVSAGVSGGQISFNKNFFFEKTASALVAAMNAQRKVTLLPILVGMSKPVTEYPLTQGLADVDAYYFAGTFLGGLQSIQVEAAAAEKKADADIQQFRTIGFVDDSGAGSLNAWVRPGGAPDAARMKLLNEWLSNPDHYLSGKRATTVCILYGDAECAKLRRAASVDLLPSHSGAARP